ncbi:non-homologous end joining protein Ku [Terriglobus tenax]|uniref:non-homologous end joining protein Ku n=1 Tax=Terriglobus tenax TaxID=1111115 RepID=UPI0021E07785|nr:Ku protein [Terriglobus tenax]
MAARPYWSGHIQISLVSFGVKLFVATESASEIKFHQINRHTGERVKYQKVNASEAEETTPSSTVSKSDIVKGYEFRKGEYIQIDPEEIANLRIPSRNTIQLEQFIALEELDPAFFEKPYFVVPENAPQTEAFATIREALRSMKKAGIGKIAFGGREHLVAIAAPSDPELTGLMAYTMRYQEELRDAKEYFADIKDVKIDTDQMELAKELIKRKAQNFDPTKWHDEYEAALRALVQAKIEHAPLPIEEEHPHTAKVINLMDALRASVHGNTKQAEPASTSRKKPSAKAPASDAKRGISIVKPAKKATKRKSA